MKKLKRPNSLFLQWEVSSVVLKTGKLGKLKRELLQIFKHYTPSRGYHVKADVLTISEMWYFLGVALFKGELLPVEVGSNSKKISAGALLLRKKDTATILGILTNPRVTS